LNVVTDEQLRAAARRLADEARLDLVVLFGSAAGPGRSRAQDLDVAVRAAHPVNLAALTDRLVTLLGVQAVDLADLRRADALLLALVARDGVPLYEREPGTFGRFASLAARRFADTAKFRAAEREAIRDFVRQREGAQ
jgi:predicted nucleotidyltransferase